MDISNSYQSSGNSSQHPNSGGMIGFDVESEKKRIALGTEELKKELLAKWQKQYANAEIFPAKIAAMHPEVLNLLLSIKLVSVYDDIAKKAGLDAKGRNLLPQIVWQVAEEKNWVNLDQILESKIPLVHSAHVIVANMLEENILNEVMKISEKPYAKKEVENEVVAKKQINLNLIEALEKYPKIQQQLITSNPLKLRYAPAPMHPSIKNWIVDFHDAFGSGKHSQMDRGNFLFHSENGKILNSSERQKVGTILKSLDDKTPLLIDEGLEVIVFERIEDVQISEKTNLTSAPREVMPFVFEPSFDVKKDLQNNSNTNTSLIQKENMAVSPIIQDSKPIMHETPKEKQVDNFFSMPQSKPPIGSSSFHEHEEVEKDNNEKVESQNVLQSGFSSNFFSPNNISFSSAQKFEAEKTAPLQQNNLIVKGNIQTPNFVGREPETYLSNEEVEQQKTPVHGMQYQFSRSAVANVEPKKVANFISQKPISEAKPIVATPRELPKKTITLESYKVPTPVQASVKPPIKVESLPSVDLKNTKIQPMQEKKIDQDPDEDLMKKLAQLKQSAKANVTMSPYRISPSGRVDGSSGEKNENWTPKINKNTVDLKN